MKKIFATFLAITLCLMTLSMNVTAVSLSVANGVENEVIDATLRSRGYPQVFLDSMSPSAKLSIYEKSDFVFDGGIITTYSQETGIFTDYEIAADGIATIGQIPASDLTLSWSISKNPRNSKELFVEYSYVWNNMPFFRWQDPIAVSWDDSLFEMKDDSFYRNALLYLLLFSALNYCYLNGLSSS